MEDREDKGDREKEDEKEDERMKELHWGKNSCTELSMDNDIELGDACTMASSRPSTA